MKNTPETLPNQQAQAARFQQARDARSAATAQDYVELISDLIATEGEARSVDVAKRLGVSHATVVKTINRLQKEGLINTKPYRGIFLTPTGEDLAAESRHRHQVVAKLLMALGVDEENAQVDAEGMEHHISAVTLAAFEAFLAREKQ
ncbi:MAG TPA: manganese-binding transcriptional regulator MntR [Thiotrichales bacterium]|jgi:DtxR family manganese transport transcriptional regulator|nr:MAG: transcriptional regulator MntR [Thiotrichales bacterium 35-46-9]HQR82885.1 manganese-binding transcriptional regulator MntR [Thiotrichales bacterium]